jgi:hypothetical protein
MSRLEIPLDDPEFLMREKEMLCALLDKHEQYEAQGRDLEARGMARAAHIAWQILKGEFVDTRPTMWGDL